MCFDVKANATLTRTQCVLDLKTALKMLRKLENAFSKFVGSSRLFFSSYLILVIGFDQSLKMACKKKKTKKNRYLNWKD